MQEETEHTGSDLPSKHLERHRCRVSVIIPTFNRLAKLGNAVQSLRHQTLPPESVEIIVVDDGSTDGTLDWLKKTADEMPNLRVLTQEHAGPAVARNLATGVAAGEILVFLGDDIVASESLLKKYCQILNKNRTDVAVQGAVGSAPSVTKTRFVRYLNDRSAAQFQLRSAVPGEVLPPGVFYTGNCAIPKRLLEQTSGFPTDVVYYDDTLVGWMLLERGVSIIYEPGAEASHDHTQTLDEFLVRQRQAGKDAAVLAMRHPELKQLLRIDQTSVFEGSCLEIGKKIIKRVLFNSSTAPLLKRIAESRLIPFPIACIIFAGLIGYEHRAAAQVVLRGRQEAPAN